jgi:hypothetical protein
VVRSASIPESVLAEQKGVLVSRSQYWLSTKHNAISYHAVCEAAATGVLQVLKEDTQTNLADLFTKLLPSDRRRELLSCILYNL